MRARLEATISGMPGERLRHRAVLLRRLGRLDERVGGEPGHGAANGQRALRDPLARLERHRRRRLEPLGRVAALGEPRRERHREARRPRRGDQLLGARLAVRLLRARRPRDVERRDRTARHALDRAAAAHQVALPDDFGLAIGCHYAITSTRRSAGSSPALALQDLPQRANRNLELVERRLSRRQPLQPEPGREHRHQHPVLRVAAGETDQLVRDARRSRAAARCG